MKTFGPLTAGGLSKKQIRRVLSSGSAFVMCKASFRVLLVWVLSKMSVAPLKATAMGNLEIQYGEVGYNLDP